MVYDFCPQGPITERPGAMSLNISGKDKMCERLVWAGIHPQEVYNYFGRIQTNDGHYIDVHTCRRWGEKLAEWITRMEDEVLSSGGTEDDVLAAISPWYCNAQDNYALKPGYDNTVNFAHFLLSARGFKIY